MIYKGIKDDIGKSSLRQKKMRKSDSELVKTIFLAGKN